MICLLFNLLCLQYPRRRPVQVLTDIRFHPLSEQKATFNITLFEMLHNRYSIWFQVDIRSYD